MISRISRRLRLMGVPALIVLAALGSTRALGTRGLRATPVQDSVPVGWFAAGTRPQDYMMVVDRGVVRAGRPSARIESKARESDGFGTLMQQIAADAYRGERVRLSGEVRVRDVTKGASLWMRVDGAGNEALAFDNAEERAARGTAEWQRFEVVLDVPVRAEKIAFGLLLAGGGTAWVNALQFEKVPSTVPVTGRGQGGVRLPAAPVNLDFGAGSR